MVYITGDIHGEVYRVSEMIEKYEITPNDIIVILGDVGMNYYGNKHGDRRNKKRLNNFDIPILCIHGNHEMRPETLITYREEPWMGGTVYFEEEFPNLFFAKDGEIYDLEGIKAIAIGGAYSVDKWYAQRKETIERVFADAKEKHAMRYTHHRGLAAVTRWVRLKYAAMNLKKLANWSWNISFFSQILLLFTPKYTKTPVSVQ